MDKKETLQEENIRRLIQAGSGEPYRPDAVLRAQLLSRLKNEVRSRQPAAAFPLPVLAAIPLVLSLMGAWMVQSASAEPTLVHAIVGVVLGVNLLCIPIASAVIIQRRRYAK